MKAFSIALSFIFLSLLIMGYVNHLVSINLLAVYVVASVATFIVYAWDKYQALRQGHRISEKTMHALTLIGGWPGALIAQQWLRHKTLKKPFRRWFWLGMVANTSALSYWYFFLMTDQ